MPQETVVLQRLLDRAAIHDVLVRYFQGIDAADFEQVRGCFTDDVRAGYDGRSSISGIDALMGSFFAFRNRASGQWKATTHFLGNLSFKLLRDDSAETECYAFACLVTPAATSDQLTIRSLRYLDRLRKTKDGWRISDRIQTLDWSCEMPAGFAAAFSSRITSTFPERTG
jgi:hypothetical protein